MSLEALLIPVDAAQPCGSNLEYDPDFLALEQAAIGKQEQQYGSTIIAAEPADWPQVERWALGLHTRTRDLRVMVHLCHAWTHLRGLDGFIDGLHLVEETLRRHGKDVFPLLEVDGEADPFLRSNALAALGDHSELGRTVQCAPLLRTAGAELSLRDACALLDRSKTECAGFPGGRTQLIDALSREDEPARRTAQALARGIESLQACIAEQAGPLSPPAMEVLRKSALVLVQVGDAAGVSIGLAPRDATAAPDGLQAPAVSPLAEGPIRSREDALRALARVQAYFRQHEPSHPAPLMLERVQRIIAMDFLQILQDLAPECLGPVKAILGPPEA